jgi:flavonoid 3'-monooxygenase
MSRLNLINCNFQEEVSRLTSNLASNYSDTKAVNLGQLLNVCTTNALSRVMLGRRVFNDGNGGCDPKADEFKEMVLELMVLAGVFNISDFIPSLEWLDLQGVQSKMKKLHKRFDAFLTNIIEEHEASNYKNEKHKNFLSTLLSLKEETDDDGNKLTYVDIKAQLLVSYLLFYNSSHARAYFALFSNSRRLEPEPLIKRRLENG